MKDGFCNSDALYHKAPPGWDTDQANPFTADGEYGSGWSVFQICDGDDNRRVYRRGSNGLFCFVVGPRVDKLTNRLADFLRYEKAWGRKVILACSENVDLEDIVRRSVKATPAGPIVRLDDPRWVVHSTTLDAWRSIRQSGRLKSFDRLQGEGGSVNGVGFHELGEPNDFAEHVMVGEFDGSGPENVVASAAKGYIFTEEDTAYTPGVRLYFDAHKIITAGLAVRDGVHTLKVHDHLPLQPYLLSAVTAADIDPCAKVKTWTPRLFLERANAWFEEQVSSSWRNT